MTDRFLAGVEPCPECGEPLPGDKCDACGYDKNAVTCLHCGTRHKGEKCPDCGYVNNTDRCRQCGADLTPNHLIIRDLRTSPDPNAKPEQWKCCAYCGWPIEKAPLQLAPTSIDEANDWAEHGHDSWTAGGALTTVVVGVTAIFLIAALIGPFGTLTKSVTGNLTATNSTASTALTPILQLYPLLVMFIEIIVIVKLFKRSGGNY